jgi:hypothetical protein
LTSDWTALENCLGVHGSVDIVLIGDWIDSVGLKKRNIKIAQVGRLIIG